MHPLQWEYRPDGLRAPALVCAAPANVLAGVYHPSRLHVRAAWDAEGPGSTFKRYYAPYEALVRRYGLPPEAKPWCYDIAETQHWLGYVPRYSLRQALEELLRYGPAGPPGPSGHGAPLPG